MVLVLGAQWPLKWRCMFSLEMPSPWSLRSAWKFTVSLSESKPEPWLSKAKQHLTAILHYYIIILYHTTTYCDFRGKRPWTQTLRKPTCPGSEHEFVERFRQTPVVDGCSVSLSVQNWKTRVAGTTYSCPQTDLGQIWQGSDIMFALEICELSVQQKGSQSILPLLVSGGKVTIQDVLFHNISEPLGKFHHKAKGRG